jgi:hypothetical protein
MEPKAWTLSKTDLTFQVSAGSDDGAGLLPGFGTCGFLLPSISRSTKNSAKKDQKSRFF